jgi:putative addiction module component (TIGR02574 family)
MITDFNSFVSQAVSLPLPERYELTQRLLDTFEANESDAQLFAELERRYAEMEAGTVRTYSHDDVMRDAREAAGR